MGKPPTKVRGFKNVDKKGDHGPINNVVVKDGKMVKIIGEGDGLGFSLASEPASVQVVLALGTRQWCLTLDEAAKSKEGKSYTSKIQAAGACPPGAARPRRIRRNRRLSTE